MPGLNPLPPKLHLGTLVIMMKKMDIPIFQHLIYQLSKLIPVGLFILLCADTRANAAIHHLGQN
jgi:hypothetical protein